MLTERLHRNETSPCTSRLLASAVAAPTSRLQSNLTSFDVRIVPMTSSV